MDRAGRRKGRGYPRRGEAKGRMAQRSVSNATRADELGEGKGGRWLAVTRGESKGESSGWSLLESFERSREEMEQEEQGD